MTLKNKHPVLSIAFSPDGKNIVAGSGYSNSLSERAEVRFFDLTDQERPVVSRALDAPVEFVAVSGDGKYVAARSMRDEFVIFSLADRKLLRRGFARGLAFSPNGKCLALAKGGGGGIDLVEPESGNLIRKLDPQGKTFYGISFSPDGRNLVGATSEQKDGKERSVICLWDTEHWRFRTVTEGGWEGKSCWAPDSKGLYVAGNSLYGPGKSHLFNLDRMSDVLLIGYRDPPAFSPDGRLMAFPDLENVEFLDAHTGDLLHKERDVHRREASAGCKAVMFSPDGRYLVTAGYWDCTVKLWELSRSDARK